MLRAVRILGATLSVGALAAVSLAGAALAPDSAAEPGGETIELTFDWPLDCTVEVDQQFYTDDFAVDATYDVAIVDGEPDDGRVVVDAGPATVTDAVFSSSSADTAALETQMAAYLTLPAMSVDADGSPAAVDDVGVWIDRFRDTGVTVDSYPDAELVRDVEFRVAAATWGTWVGLWAELDEVAVGESTLDEVTYVDELGDVASAPLHLAVEVDGSTADLVAERTLRGDDLETLWRHGYEPLTGIDVEYEPDDGQQRVTTMSVTTDIETLQPIAASFEVTVADEVDDDAELAVAHEWEFTWTECAAGASTADLVTESSAVTTTTAPSTSTTTTTAPAGPGVIVSSVVPDGFATVSLRELPPEAIDTLLLIELGGPFPYRQDGAVFENREGILPDRQYGYYQEFTVETPGSPDRGARRIVAGDGGELFYTDDHYDSFRVIVA